VLDGEHLDGGDGGAAAVWFEEWNATYIAGGGVGSKYTGSNLVAGTGGAITDPGGNVVGKSVAGDNGTLESPATGWPVSTQAKGGRPWSIDGVQGAYPLGPVKGPVYGGGGSGGVNVYYENPAGTKGGYGYAKVGWRVDPVSKALVSMGGFPNLVIRKRVDAGAVLTKTFAITTVAGLTNVLSVYRFSGVFETNTYTGGTGVLIGTAYDGKDDGGGVGVPTYSDRLVLKLEAPGGYLWFLNHSSTPSPGCVEVPYGEILYSWSTSASMPTSYTLTATVPGDSKLWEPTDVNGAATAHRTYCGKHEAQSCRVLIDYRIGGTEIRIWQVAGFVPNIYAKSAEK
jgi:hypothetical protein